MQGLLFLSKEALRKAKKFTGISKSFPFLPLRENMGKSLDSSYSPLREKTRKSLESLVFSLWKMTRNHLNFLFIPLREMTGISFESLLSFSTFQLLSFIPLYFRSISSYFKSSPFTIKRNILWDSMERLGNAMDFSSYLVKKFLGDEKRMRKKWKRMGKKWARNWMEMMGRKRNFWGENGKVDGGYANLPFLRKMRIFGFAP